MAEEKKPRTRLINLAKRYFGLKDGQALMDFGAELKALTDKDVDDLLAGLEGDSPSYTY